MVKVSFDTPSQTVADDTVSKESLKSGTALSKGEALFKSLKEKNVKNAVINTTGLSADTVAQIADGFLRASYTFNKYKTTPQNEGPQTVTFTTADPATAETAFAPMRTTTESVFWAKDLVNEPANVLNPVTYADEVKAQLEPLGIKVTILDEKKMEELGMGAALAVGQGSKTPPRMVILEWDGTNGTEKQPVALVGKGITFDSGGISIKPSAGMGDMTTDMAGSAAVAGAMRSLALRNSKSHVVGVLALAENMPGPFSDRPGDIVFSMPRTVDGKKEEHGKSIFIGNTDAEGRLVLADAISYVQEKYNPKDIIDIATLTGAIRMALGTERAGAFPNNDTLFKNFNDAAEKTGDKIWRMPLDESPASKAAVHNTPHADLTNNAEGPGALTAAAFLHEFVDKDKNGKDTRGFLHLDAAATARTAKGEGTGFGVRLFDKAVSDSYEQKPSRAAATANKHVPNPPGWSKIR